VKTIHEHIDQYEKDLDAWYAHEKDNIAQIRQVLTVSTQTGLAPQFSFSAAGDGGRKPARKTGAKAKVRDRNKTADVIGLLKRPGGASMAEIASATGWKDNSIRGFLSGVVTKKMGLPLRSMKANNERRYVIAA
jgi:hypothetical protein